MIFWSKTAEMPVEGVDVTQLLTHQAGLKKPSENLF